MQPDIVLRQELADIGRGRPIGEEGVATRAIAETIGRHLGVPVTSVAPDNAMDHFGWIGAFFALDIPASSALTRQRLGWQPKGVGLIEDLEAHYF